LVSKKVLGISTAVVVAASAFAAPVAAQEQDWTGFGNGNDTLEIVFINDGHVAPYHVAWLGGLEDAGAAYSEAFGNVETSWLSAEGSLEKMIEQAETTINENPDVMFVNAIDTEAFVPLIEKAQAQGITWIAVHSPMDEADYSFTLGDIANGYNQGLAMCYLLEDGAKVGIMLGQAGNPSGDARHEGILSGLAECEGKIEIIGEQPADWDTVKATSISENWYTQFPDLAAISGVTDAYMYPSIANAQSMGMSDVKFFGYDGDEPILQQMVDGNVMADILLSGTREGWNFVSMATNIAVGNPPSEQVYDFFTPLVLTQANHEAMLADGFPEDVPVYYVEDALDVAVNGFTEFGPDSVMLPE
jgi:ABC-type sugar transport system substrate-binding protein